MPNRVSTFVGLVCGLACVALLFAYLTMGGIEAGGSYAQTAFALAAFGFAAELLSFTLPQGGSGSIAFIPYVAVALAVPTWIAPIAVGVAAVASQMLHRRPFSKSAFNVAQAIVAVTLGVCAYRVFGGPFLALLTDLPLKSAAQSMFGPAAALSAVYVLVNTYLVSCAIAISSERRVIDVWRVNTLSTITYFVLTAPIALLLAWSYVRGGPIAAAAVIIPMIGVRQLYSISTQLQRTNQELLEMMVKAIEARDPYTSGHSRRVSNYSVVIAKIIGLGDGAIERVRIAGLLHDVGKIHESFAPILRKPGKLTDDEWALMKTHPAKGAELIETLTHLRDLVPAIRHHHEQWSGGGYPDGLHGDQIPLTARIIMFADTMDAMLSDRPYRAALSETEVRAELAKWKGVQFDPAVCDALLRSVQFSELISAGVAKERARTTPPSMRAIAGRAMASVRRVGS
jgi:HD superfamily phosphohydrolase YqeK